jgi:hypothetical protein
MIEIPKYEEIKLEGRRVCTYLRLIISFRKGHRMFDCTCYQSTGSGCMKDGICPLYIRMMKRSNVISLNPSLLEQFKQLEIEEYKADNCNHCPNNRFCKQEEDDIRDCKIEDMIRRADEEDEKERCQKLHDETEKLIKAERELEKLKEDTQKQIDKEELKQSLDESDAHVAYCEEQKQLGDPVYQDTTEEDRKLIAQEIAKEDLQKSIDESDAHQKYCNERKSSGDPAYRDC